MKNNTFKTSNAIAYLKKVVKDDDGSNPLTLSQADSPVIKDHGNNLITTYVVDAGNQFKYIQYCDIEADSITVEQLDDVGLNNLAAIAASGELRVAPHANVFAVLLDGNFEASMILLDDLWNDLFRQFVQGNYLIALPTREVLAFCDASSDIGRTELLELIDRLRDQCH
ncbi:MAG: DUF1444 family protein [Cyanobacteria bacterium P01_D01_bin.123]